MKSQEEVSGEFCKGRGNPAFLNMLNDAWSVIQGPGQNLMMLHDQDHDLFYEGPEWKGVWTQNTYGMYTWAPIIPDEQFRILDNSYNYWFAHQGDGKKKGNHGLVPPPGALMDCVGLDGNVHYRQGDGNWAMHDLFLEGTLAGVICKSENLLAARDMRAIGEYLPKLELAMDLVWSRRDAKTGLLRSGPASNLLAPNYAGTLMPDGTYGDGYLSGLLVTFAAAAAKMAELKKLAGDEAGAGEYTARRESAVAALLEHMLQDDGYLIKYIDMNGERHGVFGAEKWGYFCASPNHDAIAHRVVDDALARKIFNKIEAIHGLRPHGFVCANYPGLDDTYKGWGQRDDLPDIWVAGHWVNGGGWLTCESRMVMAYYVLNDFDDAIRIVNMVVDDLRNEVGCAVRINWGGGRYKDWKGHFDLDTFGVPGAALRGVFEYIYSADSLRLIPHFPADIETYEQLQPARFGAKRIFIKVTGAGTGTESAMLDGKPIPVDSEGSVEIMYDAAGEKSFVEIQRR